MRDYSTEIRQAFADMAYFLDQAEKARMRAKFGACLAICLAIGAILTRVM
jgi:hypothetical protein